MDIVMLVLKIALLLVAAVMTFFILLQEGKGGGLAALGGTKAAGVEGVTNPIRRATAYLAGLFFLLAIAIGFLSRDHDRLTGTESVAEPGKALQSGKEDEPKPNMLDLPLPALGPVPAKSEPKTAEPQAGEVKTGTDKTVDVKAAETKTGEPAKEALKTEAPAVEAKTPEPPKPDAAKTAPAVEVKTPEPAKTGEAPAK